MERRAALIARLRSEEPSAILVDAGGALFGPDGIASGGRAIVRAFDALGYGAMNLSFRDFRRGKAATLAAIREAKFAVLSANLLDSGTGEPIARPYVVIEAGGEAVAILGVTEAPAGLDFLPHLKEQLSGIRFDPPVAALARWLPEVKARAGRAVLLYHGSAAALGSIVERFSGDFAAIFVGGMPAEHLPPAARPPLISTEENIGHGAGREVLARARIAGAGAETRVEVSRFTLDPSLPADSPDRGAPRSP